MSSGSESDEDYVPKEAEQLSEEESADDQTEAQYENEVDQKTKKRKAVQKKSKKKKKISNGDKVESKEENETVKDETKPEDEKKREDDLWAMFLEGTDTKPKSANSSKTEKQPTKTVTKCDTLPTKITSTNTKTSSETDKEKERRIFEFAGETIVVENNVIKEKIKATESSPSVSKTMPSRSRGGGGLSNVLGQLNKKNKLSTLEKSKLDWDTFKKEEDIEAEIKSHNKGKQGYLERQDFLARADERQYEIERDLRLSKRSNR
ncbi:Craniofacial development protein 1 [Papilio xuthus]|uniref:Craniofacial development protein 1 n=1 Tax=Papilio xuthus TaxID=66420 RepID=A0A194PV65_PAPXU|nr:Craniofacial development protein 1 [Papilio xuthus]